jgi:hypothetical protein
MLLLIVTDVSKDRTALFRVKIPRRINHAGILDPELDGDIFYLNGGNCLPLDTA